MSEQNFLALPAGFQLNQYTIDSVLGQGGFGIVYKAHHQHLGEVVIKEFLPAEMAGRDGTTVTPHSTQSRSLFDDSMQRFINEGRVLVKLRHHNVVRCRDLFEANGTAYLVMDFEDGLPFSDLLKSLEGSGGHYNEEQLLQVFKALASGLEYIHKQNVLHRDIKPGNLFIRRSDNSPVLLDFGAAKQEFAEVSQSRAPFTEFYAPIEQSDPSVPATERIDIHALGGLMYRATTGTIGPKAESRALSIATGKPDPLEPATKLAEGKYSHALLALIDECLAFDANKRPANMSEVVHRLSTLDNQSLQADKTLSERNNLANKNNEIEINQPSQTHEEISKDAKASSFPWGKFIVIAVIITMIVLVFVWRIDWSALNSQPKEPIPKAYLFVSSSHDYLDLDKSDAMYSILDLEKSLLINNRGLNFYVDIEVSTGDSRRILVRRKDQKEIYIDIENRDKGLAKVKFVKDAVSFYPLEIVDRNWIKRNLKKYFTAPDEVKAESDLCQAQRFAWISNSTSRYLFENNWTEDKFEQENGFYVLIGKDENFAMREYYDPQSHRLFTTSQSIKTGTSTTNQAFYKESNPTTFISYGCEQENNRYRPIAGTIIRVSADKELPSNTNKKQPDSTKQQSLSKEESKNRLEKGSNIYASHCAVCHSTGVAGAPKIGDKKDWEKRITEKRIDNLYLNAVNGINAMPPMGLCNSCSDEEIKATVDYILSKSQ